MAEVSEQIVRYLQNEMSKAEKSDFEQRLNQSQDLQQLLQEMEIAMFASQLHGQQRLRNQLTALESELSQQDKPVRSLRLYWVIAASVLLLAIAGIWYLNRPKSASDYFTEYFVPYRAPINLRGGPEEMNQWEAARQAYVDGDFAGSAQGFASISDSVAPIYLRDFYHGMSLLNQTPPAITQAIPLLQSVSEGQHDYREIAAWYVALAYLQNEQPQEAIPYLQSLKSYRSAEAKKILESLTSP